MTLWRCLKSKDYAFRKTGGNRHILCERGDLRRARATFLRKIKEARRQGLNLVFLDETWINAHHAFIKEWMKKEPFLPILDNKKIRIPCFMKKQAI